MSSSRVPVSVVICTYNGSKFIRSQILSILSVLNPNDQVIVSDDCSSDNTVEIINSLRDHRIKTCINNTNLGYAKNFLQTLSSAEHNFIILADQDDIHSPHSISSATEALSSGFDLYIGSMLLTNSSGTPQVFLGFPSNRKIYRWDLIQRFLLVIRLFLGVNYAFGCAMSIKKSSYQRLLRPLPLQVYPPHDILLFLYSLLCFKKIFLSSSVHLLHRIHCSNASPLVSKRKFHVKIRQRLTLIHYLLSSFTSTHS